MEKMNDVLKILLTVIIYMLIVMFIITLYGKLNRKDNFVPQPNKPSDDVPIEIIDKNRVVDNYNKLGQSFIEEGVVKVNTLDIFTDIETYVIGNYEKDYNGNMYKIECTSEVNPACRERKITINDKYSYIEEDSTCYEQTVIYYLNNYNIAYSTNDCNSYGSIKVFSKQFDVISSYSKVLTNIDSNLVKPRVNNELMYFFGIVDGENNEDNKFNLYKINLTGDYIVSIVDTLNNYSVN